MTIETDIGFWPRGSFTRNGVIREAQPETYTKTANGLYVKYRRCISAHMWPDGEKFVPDGGGYVQANANAGLDLTQFNTFVFLGQPTEAREDALNQYRLILHVFGRDVLFRATFVDQNFTMVVDCTAVRAWYNVEVADQFADENPRWDNVYFECDADGSNPGLRGWKLEEAIMDTGDAP